jgi:hypothetical protein
MASAAFIEPLPVVEFVGQLLGKDVLSRQLSDADRIKVLDFVNQDLFGMIYLSSCIEYKLVRLFGKVYRNNL